MNEERNTKPYLPHMLAWTAKDVARELKCSLRHVYTLVSEGKIPYSKLGRLVRFSPYKVREWLEKGGTR